MWWWEGHHPTFSHWPPWFLPKQQQQQNSEKKGHLPKIPLKTNMWQKKEETCVEKQMGGLHMQKVDETLGRWRPWSRGGGIAT